MKLDEDQKRIVNAKEPNMCVIAGAGSGKALSNSTEVLTPLGCRLISELKLGDSIYDRFGNVCEVEGIYPQGKKQVIEITFDGGNTVQCCEDHLWFVGYKNNAYEFEVVNTKTILKLIRTGKNLYIPTFIPSTDILIKTFEEIVPMLEPFLQDKISISLYNSGGNLVKNCKNIQEFLYVLLQVFEKCYMSISVKTEQFIIDSIKTRLETLGFTCQFKEPNSLLVTYADTKKIVSVKQTDKFLPMTCIKVNSKDESFVIEHGIVTHNTTVLTEKVVKTIKESDKNASIVCITFTNLAANEMRHRIGLNNADRDNIFIGTIHSLAYKLLNKFTTKHPKLLTETAEFKIVEHLNKQYKLKISKDELNTFKKNRRLILSGIAKECDLYKGIKKETTDKLKELYSKFSSNECNVFYYARNNGYITFSELLVLCKKHIEENDLNIDYMFVDEFQDIGIYEKEFIFGLNPKHMFVVGDDYQCQPKGTVITLYDGSKKLIEDLKVGDALQTYDRKNSRIRKYSQKSTYDKAKVVTSIQKDKAFKIIKLISNNEVLTSCTLNHRCYARLNKEILKDSYAVYIEGNENDQYKVDFSQLFVQSEYGKPQLFATRRMLKDHANKLWVISCANTKKEAYELASIIAYKYGIPMLSWNPEHSGYYDELNNIYEALLPKLRNSVKKCLADYNRDIKYPFRDADSEKFSNRSVFTIRACNLIPNLFEIPKVINDKFKFETLSEVKIERGKFEVYALNVEDDHNYIADSILTGNSIYSFNGGTPEFLQELTNNEEFSTHVLKNNYRSNPHIVKYGNDLMSTQKDVIFKECVSKTGSKLGNIVAKEGTIDDIVKLLKTCKNTLKDWFILTRSNDDAVDIQHALYHNKIPYETFKKRGISDNGKIEAMLNRNSVKILTIHSAKGLESKNVILYGDFPTDVKNIKNSSDSLFQIPEEVRIFYVGVTRAKENLLIIKPPFSFKPKNRN